MSSSLPVGRGRGSLVRIRGVREWPEAQQRVADYTLNNPSRVTEMAIEELAEVTGVSTATIVRFCRKLGFRGFSDFKRQITVDVLTSPKDIHEEIERGDTLPVIAEKVYKTAVQTLTDTLAISDNHAIEKAVRTIAEAKRIEIYGVGGSGVVALDTQHKFLTIGLPCVAFIDSHLQSMSASLLDEQSVAIAVSHSGSTAETIRSLHLARQAGAHTICVTNYRHSPITRYADIVLLTASRETTTQGIPVASRMAQILVLDVIFVGAAMRRYDQSVENIYRTATATKEYPG